MIWVGGFNYDTCVISIKGCKTVDVIPVVWKVHCEEGLECWANNPSLWYTCFDVVGAGDAILVFDSKFSLMEIAFNKMDDVIWDTSLY